MVPTGLRTGRNNKLSAGLTIAGKKELHEVAQRAVADRSVPGLVALAARGGDVQVEAAGVMAAGGPPMAPDTIFRIASATKPITAAVTLALAAEGLLDIDEPVDRLLPELASRRVLRRMDGPLDDTVPARRPITVRDLLTFTFGFGDAFDMFFAPEPWPVMAAAGRLRLATLGPPDPDVQPDPGTWIANLGTLPLLAQPGERWLYNTGASVLGVLAARAAASRSARCCGPGSASRSACATPASGPPRPAGWPRPTGPPPWPDGLGPARRVVEQAAPVPRRRVRLGSTAGDLLAFSGMMLRGGAPVLPAELVRAMTSDQLTPEQKARGGLGPGFFADKSWGFCLAVQDDGSYGWAGGFGTTWLIDPGRDLAVIVLTQRQFDSPEPPAVHTEFQRAAYAALG